VKQHQIISETYIVSEKIGHGGMSEVFAANHIKLQRKVAVKIMSLNLLNDQRSLARFQHEGQVVCRLSHPNIAPVYDCGILPDGRPFLVMDYVEGTTLADVIGTVTPVPAERALAIIEQVCIGLSYAHKQGVLHRDIKPSNVMISRDGNGRESAVILDFGLAKLMTAEDGSHRFTMTGETVGTPSYMSPEQCLGKRVDARSDIYSLGCLMYETLTGKKPFEADNAIEMIGMHLEEKPPAFSVVAPLLKDLPPLCEHVVLKALEKNPDDRPQTVDEVMADLHALKQGAPGVGSMHLWSKRVKGGFRKSARSPVFTVGISAMVVGLVVGAAVAWHVFRHQPVVYKFNNTALALATAKELNRTTISTAFLDHDFVSISYVASQMVKHLDACPATIADIDWLMKIGDAFVEMDRFEDAAAMAKRAAQLSDQLGVEAAGLKIRARLLSAVCTAATGARSEGEGEAQLAVAAAKQMFGANHQNYAESLGYLGIVHLKCGKPADAVKDFTAAADVLTKFVAETEPSVFRQRTWQARALIADKKFADAKDMLNKLLQQYTGNSGGDPSVRSSILGFMAKAEQGLGEDEKAMALYAQAAKEQLRVATVYPEFAEMLTDYANLLKRHGFGSEASRNFEQAKQIREALGMPNNR
jgi:serine/threonine protein kinase